MVLFACECLNVSLECDKIEENITLDKLPPIEQRDNFFSEILVLTSFDSLKVLISQPELIRKRTFAQWTIYACLACNKTTHAVSGDTSDVLISKSMQTTSEEVNNLKKFANYSPVFNLLVPEVNNQIKENIDTNNLNREKKIYPQSQLVIGNLNKQLNQTLQSQLEFIEDSVRQYRDQKYAEYEAYRERAQRDHKILASIISEKKDQIDSDGLKNVPISSNLPLQRRRSSSQKDANKHKQNLQSGTNTPNEEDSLEMDDVFDMDGPDSNSNPMSDLDDYDADDGSNEDSSVMRRARAEHRPEIARSLPMNMPILPLERPRTRDGDHEEEPQDIAASIKALARSVHGDVFELPRPRFSTQI